MLVYSRIPRSTFFEGNELLRLFTITKKPLSYHHVVE